MAYNETWINHDMMNAVKVQYLDGNVFSMDNAGNLIGVLLTKGGVDYSGGGSVSANVIRADGATVPVTGALSGNVATVVLPQAAYAFPGVISIVVKLTIGGAITTIAAVVANVYQTTTDAIVDPGTIIPSIETLIAEINAAIASIPADYSSLWATLAPVFNASGTYVKGQYVTYNGGLYRFKTAHTPGSWDSSQVDSVTVGLDLKNLSDSISGVSKYPFDKSATVFNIENQSDLKLQRCAKAIKDVKISNWHTDWTYYIRTCYFNATNSGAPLTLFQIYADKNDGQYSTIQAYVGSFAKNNYTGIQSLTLPSANPTFPGNAVITVDFSEINTGDIVTFGNQMGKLSYLCYSGATPIIVHPFICAEPTDETLAKVYNAVKDIRVYGANNTDDLFIYQFYYNNSAITPTTTYITLRKGTTTVARYDSSIIETGVKEITFEEADESGICATALIDFSQFSANFQTSTAGSIDSLGISKDCFVEDEEIVSLQIPDTIYAVVGYESNIYWNSAVQCGNINDYKILVSGKGENVGNRWRYIPASAETFTFTVVVKNQNMRTVAKKTVSVVAKTKAVETATTIKAIHIGDSMIDNEYHIPELIADFNGTNITYNTYGTENGGRDEGRGGWTTGMYMTTASDSGVTNAFYNPSTETFDFTYYMNQHSNIPVPNYVFIFLGTNDVKSTSTMDGMQYQARATSANIEAMIQSIKEYNNNIKVCVCSASIGAQDQYPYGLYYGDNRIKQPLQRYGIQMQIKTMMNKFCGRESEGIYFIPTGTSLDNINGFPTTEVDASERITKQITVQSDMYHPTSEGYNQFADAEFCFIRNQLS